MEQLTELEFLRDYGPDIRMVELTDFGLKRLDENMLPTHLPFRSYGLLRLLKRLGMAEEDELADYTGLSLEDLRKMLTRLAGYGYIKSVGGEK